MPADVRYSLFPPSQAQLMQRKNSQRHGRPKTPRGSAGDNDLSVTDKAEEGETLRGLNDRVAKLQIPTQAPNFAEEEYTPIEVDDDSPEDDQQDGSQVERQTSRRGTKTAGNAQSVGMREVPHRQTEMAHPNTKSILPASRLDQPVSMETPALSNDSRLPSASTARNLHSGSERIPRASAARFSTSNSSTSAKSSASHMSPITPDSGASTVPAFNFPSNTYQPQIPVQYPIVPRLASTMVAGESEYVRGPREEDLAPPRRSNTRATNVTRTTQTSRTLVNPAPQHTTSPKGPAQKARTEDSVEGYRSIFPQYDSELPLSEQDYRPQYHPTYPNSLPKSSETPGVSPTSPRPFKTHFADDDPNGPSSSRKKRFSRPKDQPTAIKSPKSPPRVPMVFEAPPRKATGKSRGPFQTTVEGKGTRPKTLTKPKPSTEVSRSKTPIGKGDAT